MAKWVVKLDMKIQYEIINKKYRRYHATHMKKRLTIHKSDKIDIPHYAVNFQKSDLTEESNLVGFAKAPGIQSGDTREESLLFPWAFCIEFLKLNIAMPIGW